jgi:hypothetical protein
VLPQLHAVRAQIELLVAQVEAALGVTEPAPPPGTCPHPKNRQRNATVLGGPTRWLCLDCGEEYGAPS